MSTFDDPYGDADGDRALAAPGLPELPLRNPAGDHALVIVHSRDRSLIGTRIPLDESPFTLGRGPDSHLVLKGEQVSRRHAQLTFEGAAWSVRDADSVAGTYVNDEAVDDRHVLTSGDRITIVSTILRLFAGEGDAITRAAEEIARLREVDGLTDLWWASAWSARIAGRDGVVLTLEIEGFARMDIDMGERAADCALVTIAGMLKEMVPADAVLGRSERHDGELSLFLPTADVADVRAFAVDVANRILCHPFTAGGETFTVKVSASVEPRRATTA